MVNNYIENGQVARNKIALDIKYRRLTRTEIKELIKNPQIKSAFFGDVYTKKTEMKNWNKSYLNELSYVAIAESFNEEYLLYLDEVAEFVSKAKYKKVVVAGIIMVLVIIAGIVVFSYIL